MKKIFKSLMTIVIVILLCSPLYALETKVGTSIFTQTTDKFDMNKPLTAYAKVLSIAASCTIGTDCDSTSVEATRGGLIFVTATATITLPEIVASSPTATQVVPGASICFWVQDHNEQLDVNPNAADSLIMGATKDTAGHGTNNTVTAATGGGDRVCFVAVAADAWTVWVGVGTWVAK